MSQEYSEDVLVEAEGGWYQRIRNDVMNKRFPRSSECEWQPHSMIKTKSFFKNNSIHFATFFR